MMTLDKKITFIRAFDTMDVDDRVVINYARVEEPASETTKDMWTYVDKVFVSCKGTEFFVDMWKFEMKDMSGELVDKIVTDDFVLLGGGASGQSEIMLDMKTKQNSLKVLFLHRDKTFRVVESTFPESQVRGVLHTRRVIELETLDYVDEI